MTIDKFLFAKQILATKVRNIQVCRAKKKHRRCLSESTSYVHFGAKRGLGGILEPWFLNLGAPESPGGFVETDYTAPPSQFLTQWV